MCQKRSYGTETVSAMSQRNSCRQQNSAPTKSSSS